jgi:hypothetical protein
MKPSHLSVATIPGQINWRCSACGQPTRTGALHIDLQQVRQAERSLAAWERRHADPDGRAFNLAELMTMPRVEPWRVDCNTCCHDCAGCYTIELAQCQSLSALIRWTHHLYDKNWFKSTDWIGFIHQVAQANGSPTETAGVW